MASLQLVPTRPGSDADLVRALLFSLRIQHSPQAQPLRESAIDRIVERDLLLAGRDRGLTVGEILEGSTLSFGGRSALSQRDIPKCIDRLIAAQVVIRKPVVAPAAYTLTEAADIRLWAAQNDAETLIRCIHSKLFRNLPSCRETFERAFDAVISSVFAKLGEMYVRSLRGLLSKNDLAGARIVQNAIDSASTVYGESVREVLTASVARFFRENDVDFDRLKWNLSQNFYVAKALGLDSSGELLTREIFGHSAFYLDTNVIIAALEPTDSRHVAFKSFVSACKRLDISLFVSQITLHELRNVVIHYRGLFARVGGEVPDALASFVSDYFYQAYRRQSLANGPVTLDEFFARFESPGETLEKEYGITRVDASWFVRELESTETARMACELQSLRPTKTKTAATHDALMIRWVDRTRDVDKENVYFLTFDRSLPLRPTSVIHGHPTSLALDALLQWMGPNIADEGLLSDFARIYSSAIQQQLLPVDNFFELSDFCMLAEMECECSELPVEDVIECLQIIKSRAPELDPARSEDREKLAHEIQRFFAGPGRKHHEAVDRLRSCAEATEQHLRSEVASRDTAITCKDARIANLEGTLTEKERSSQDFLERTKLRHSALIRAIVCDFLFTFSELLSLTLALAFGTGPNMMQRVTSSWVFLAGQLPFWGHNLHLCRR